MTTDSIDLHFNSQNSAVVTKAAELLSLIDTDFFLYYLRYDNGNELKCTNRPDWVKYYTENGLYQDSTVYSDFVDKTPAFYLFDHYESDTINQVRSNQFNIDHVIAWIDPTTPNCVEIFQFGADTPKKHMVNFYINHLKLLRRFIAYFKNEMAPDIAINNDNLLLSPHSISLCDESNLTLSDHALKEFESSTKIKSFQLCGQYHGESITARELDCLYELATGQTMKEIAKSIEISPRTVETHLNHVKDKLSLATKSDLIQFARCHFSDFL